MWWVSWSVTQRCKDLHMLRKSTKLCSSLNCWKKLTKFCTHTALNGRVLHNTNLIYNKSFLHLHLTWTKKKEREKGKKKVRRGRKEDLKEKHKKVEETKKKKKIPSYPIPRPRYQQLIWRQPKNLWSLEKNCKNYPPRVHKSLTSY